MPQKLDLQSYDDLTPKLDIQSYENPKQSTADWWIEQGLRTAPAVIGGIGGGLLGNVPGGMAGGAAGAALGNVLGNWYSGKEFNPYEFGVETALGGVPPILGPAKFVGKGLPAIAKYAAKNAASGALEGGVVSGAGTPFQHWAQTGSFNAPLEEYAQNVGAGTLMGAGIGGGIGAYHGRGLDKIANAPPSTPPPSGARPQFGQTPPAVYGPEIGPYGTGEGQQKFPFMKPRISAAEFAAMRDAQPTGQGSLFPQEVPPTSPPPPAAPPPPPSGELPKIVTITHPDASQNALLRSQGYVPIGVDANGRPQMARGDVAPLYVTGDKKPAPPAPPQTASPFGPKRVVPGEEIPVPIEKLSKNYVNNMEEGGWRESRREGGMAFFKRFISEDKGTFDPAEMWANLKRLLGRDPTPEEVEQGLARQVRPGEQTGRVAPFEPRPTVDEMSLGKTPPLTPESWRKAMDELGYHNPNVLPPEQPRPSTTSEPPADYTTVAKLQQERDPNKLFQQSVYWSDRANKLKEAGNTDEYLFAKYVADSARDLYNKIRSPLGMSEGGVNIPEPKGPPELPFGHPAEGLHPLMQERIEEAGPANAVWDYTGRMTPVEQGQLFPMEMRAQTRLQDIANARPEEGQPEQMMLPTREEAEAELLEEAKRRRIQGINENIDAGLPPMEEQTPFQTGWDKLTPEGQRAVSQQSADQFNTEAGLQQPELPPEPPISKMEAPRGERPGEFQNRVEILKQGIDEAYRIGDMNRVVDLSQQLEEAMNPSLGQDRGASPYVDEEDLISEMQVRQGGYGGGGPVIINPQTGRPNLAMGGADPQVVRQLGQSLYTRDRPSVLIQELFQNTIDEMKIAGIQEPVRVVFINNSENPVTKADQKSIVFQDFGRGMNESQLYNEFSDVGKSGKRHIQGAAGGFGFAKAAPFLGGEYMRVESITMEGGDKVRYTFEGNPEQFVDQEVGVPLNREVLDNPYDMNYDKSTGMRVEVFFERNKYFHNAQELLQMVSENSKGVNNIESFNNFGSLEDSLKSTSSTSKFIRQGEQGLSSYNRSSNFDRFGSQPPPAYVSTITTPSNDTAVHFDLDQTERQSVILVYLNNGTFYHANKMAVGMNPLPHIPKRIVFDINTKVPEGHTDYPFPANREGINQNVDMELRRWINDNVIKPARQTYLGEIQQVYNNLQPVAGNRHVILDSGAKYTPDELTRVQQSPTLKRMGGIMETLLEDLARYYTPAEVKGTTGKFGYRIADEGKGGVNIHDPSSPQGATKYAILVNPFDALRSGFSGGVQDLTPQQAARRFVHLIKHEFNHNIARDEGAGYTWAYSQLDTRFPNTEHYVSKVLQALTGSTGNYVAEIPSLLREYTAARGRPESQVDILSRQADSSPLARPGQTGVSGGNPPNGAGIPATKKEGLLKQLYHAPRGLMASWDFSAPLRQGLPMIHTKEWWTSWAPMVKSWGSKNAYESVMNDIKSRPEFQKTFDPETGKFSKSHAEESGLRLTDITEGLTGREENTIGGLVEKVVPGIGRSNRAYTAYLNSLRADSFRSLLDAAEKVGLNPRTDMVLSKQIAEYVNTATGRGSLGALEQNAKLLTDIFFAPRLMASRLRMLNPATYVMAPPFVRKQYMKSLFGTAAAWTAIAGLGKLAGAEVSLDPSSSDFGKIRIGNTRIDPAGGFQQYLVAAYRLITGKVQTSGGSYETGGDFPAPTRREIAQRFIANKANPVLDFAYDFLDASRQRPVYGGDRLAQMALPMIVADVIELANENPELIPFVIPATAVGMGSQSYERGQEEPKIVPREYDPLKFEGGAMF